jgi:hypothetical protein
MFEAIFQKDHNIRYKGCGVDILDAFRLSLQFLQEDKVMTKINSKDANNNSKDFVAISINDSSISSRSSVASSSCFLFVDSN